MQLNAPKKFHFVFAELVVFFFVHAGFHGFRDAFVKKAGVAV